MTIQRDNFLRSLISDCEAALNAKPTRAVTLNGSTRHPPDLSELEQFDCAIYVFREIGGDAERTFSSLKDYKAKGERSCPRLNAESSILYVGSSIGNVFQRIRQHIGPTKMLKTYALHLDCWFDGNYEITVEEYDLSPRALQILEDAISYSLMPAFGKKGGNSSQ